MERIKYIVFSLLVLIGLVVPGELYQSYTGCFADFYEVSFYLQPDSSRDTMLADISATAEQHHVSVFMMDQTVENLFTNTITVYGDDTVQEYLEKEYYLQEGRCKSLFSGSTTVQFLSFFDAPDELITARTPKYYLLGEYDDMVLMKQELVEAYAGSFPRVNGYSTLGEMQFIHVSLWIVLLLLFCFIAFYSLTTAQRELMVRVSMGERRMTLYLKRVLMDAAVLVGSYVVFSWILSHFNAVAFLSAQRHWMLIGSVIGVCLVNTYLFRFQVRMAFQHSAGQNILTAGTYIIKVIACCFSLLTLTLAFATATECLSYYKQRSFFEENKTCHYVDVLIPDASIQEMIQIEMDFLLSYYEKSLFSDPIFSGEEGNESILMSHSMLPYLREWIPSLASVEITADVCLLYPEGLQLTEEEQEILASSVCSCYGCEPDSFTVQYIAYPDDAEVIEIERDLHPNYSAWKKNPIILMTTWDRLPEYEGDEYSNYMYYSFRTYNFMVDAPKEELQQLVQNYDGKVIATNCYEYFLHCWNKLKRTLYLSVLLIIMIFWLNIAVSILLVRFTYKKNAMELAVKKLTGYTRIERMKPVVLTSAITIAVSTLCCMVGLLIMGSSVLWTVLLAAILIGLLDYCVIRTCSIRYETENLSKILKGGSI